MKNCKLVTKVLFIKFVQKNYLMKTCFKILFALLTYYSCTNEKNSKNTFIESNPREVSYVVPLSRAFTQPVDFVEAAEKSIDAVVHVKNTSSVSDDFSYLDYFYGRNRKPQNRIGTGSGVIVSPDGLIITNNHVIEDATKIEVTTNDNVRYEAKLVGTDPYTDIAVLKIQTQKPLPYLYFGNSDNTKIGEWVLAIGNPFNLNSTVTAGIISAKSRDLNKLDRRNQSFIQTDAAVNQGNSGGALVNLSGELIGINTAITTISGGFEGYSFAVPSNIARKVFEDIIEFGTNQKGMLGVQGFAISPEFEKFVNENNIKQTEGFYVSNVLENIIQEVKRFRLDGIIATNSSTIRPNKLDKNLQHEEGGLSGKLIYNLSTDILKKVADKDLLTIGVGGVFSKEDFKEKISNGADLVQVYSGFIFKGPSLIKTILG